MSYETSERTRGARFLRALATVAAALADRIDDAPPVSGVAVRDEYPFHSADRGRGADYDNEPTPLVSLQLSPTSKDDDAPGARNLHAWGDVLADVTTGEVTGEARLTKIGVAVTLRADLPGVLLEAWGVLSSRLADRWGMANEDDRSPVTPDDLERVARGDG